MSNLAEKVETKDGLKLGILKDSFGYLVRMAQIRAFETSSAHVGEVDFKPGEFSVLWIISLNPNVRQGEVARQLAIKPAHMTKVIQRQEAKGLVERHIPENDRRSVRLALTAKGQEHVTALKDAYFNNDHMHSPLDAEEFDQLLNLLQKFIAMDEGQL